MRPPAAASPRRRAPPVPTDQGDHMSDIEFTVNRSLLRDILTNQCEADVLVDLIRASGVSHETSTITVVVVDEEA